MAVMMLCVESLGAREPMVVPLWPDGAPTANGLEGKAETYHRGDKAKVGGISEPMLYVFPAKHPNGQAIVCAPGGGYAFVSTESEGFMMADWMNARGITFAVLKYRMPNGHCEVPLEDGCRAMKIMRELADSLGFNRDEVGIMGHSAGGHFAATLATLYGDEAFRPDFQILLYPVITMNVKTHGGTRKNLLGDNPTEEKINRYSLDKQVNASTPEAFILLASDDKTVPPVNSLWYAEALDRCKVPFTMHIFPKGGHGFGFLDSFPYKQQYTGELDRWLRKMHDDAQRRRK